MSHFTVLVITDNEPTAETLHAALLPYHEYECTGYKEYTQFVPEDMDELQKDFAKHGEEGQSFDDFVPEWNGAEKNEEGVWGRLTNPNAKWDWYQVGGRWSGSLLTNSGERVDSCKLSDLALTEMLDEAEKGANRWYDDFEEITKDKIFPPAPWKTFRGDYDDIEEARAAYREYSAVTAVTTEEAQETLGFFFFDDVLSYSRYHNGGREAYVSYKRNSALSSFALLKEGAWIERGDMGWFGMVADEKDPDAWQAQFTKALLDLPSDAWLTMVDCHI